MAWIESHQALEKHPKMYDLMNLTGCTIDEAIGRLHRFWWWCVDYAEDGDLRKHNDARIGAAVGLNGEQAKLFVKAMVEACWLDRKPYFRVHDWWDYIGKFLQIKYRHNPEKWQRIKALYAKKKTGSKTVSKTGSKTHNQPTDLNQPNQHTLGEGEEGIGVFESEAPYGPPPASPPAHEEPEVPGKEPEPEKKAYGEFGNVKLTDEEYEKLKLLFGDKAAGDYIERLSGHLASTGKRYKSHYATIRNWLRGDNIAPFKLCAAGDVMPQDAQDKHRWRHPEVKEVTNPDKKIKASKCVHCETIFDRRPL